MAQTTTATMSLDTAAYNKAAWFALRPELVHEVNAETVKSTPQTHKGASVSFDFINDLAPNTTPLTETSDVTSKNLTDAPVVVTLAEYGDVLETTAKVYNTSYIEFDPIVANEVGWHQGISMDTLVRDTLLGGTGVQYAGGVAGRSSIAASNVLASAELGKLLAAFANASVKPFASGLYRLLISPDQEFDLKRETGELGWNYTAARQMPAAIRSGLVGDFGGFEVVRTPRTSVLSNAGNGSVVDVYQSIALGREAIAKAFSTGIHGDGQALGAYPLTIKGPFTDSLYRFRKLGWYHFVGYGVFRQAALKRLETASSLANNAS